MSGRNNTIKNIRSKIKHENANLGAGTASATFSDARQHIPHVGEAFGQHPGPTSMGAGPLRSPTGGPMGGPPPMSGGMNPAYNPSGPGQAGYGAGPSFVSSAPSVPASNFEARHNLGFPQSHPQQGPQYGRSPPHQQQQQLYGRSSSPINQSTASFAMDPGYSVPPPNVPPIKQQHARQPSRPDMMAEPPGSPMRPLRSARRSQQVAPSDMQKSFSAMSSNPSTLADRRGPPPQRPQLQIPPVGPTPRSAQSPTTPPARSAPGRDLLAASRSGGHSRNPSAQTVGSSSVHQQATPPSDRHARSAQLMANAARTGSPASQESDDHHGSYAGHSPIDAPSDSHANRLSVPGQRPQRDPRRQSNVPLGSLTHDSQPAALDSVLSALSDAGRKRQAARIMRGTTAEEESRRRRNEKKISESSRHSSQPISAYVDRNDPRAFQSINAVLRKVEAEWPFVANDQFNSVALALSMLDNRSLGASCFEFDEVKQLIETALQGTVDDHYESFATAITMHHSVLTSLTHAQTSVSGARRRLRDSREALGAKRADLVQMWQRSQAVKEALRLLDLVEHLKSVPDKLESLMAEKRFLESVNLLVRSLKSIDKPEVVEVGATNDLRAYLKGQEQAMLEILIEELHNHLYLKSYFCDARWKAYIPGQEALPVVKFGSDYANDDADAKVTSPSSTALNAEPKPFGESLQLTRFLQSLRSRPSFDPNLASDIPEAEYLTSSTKGFSALTGESASDLRPTGRYGAEFEQNPEADSFLYIEMLLESLARLGKLGTALEIISQRLAMEVHQLVDTTIDEVDARNEPLRRFSVALRPESVLLSSSSALARWFTESLRSSRSSFHVASGRPVSTMLRISAGQTSALQRNGETMRDLFWTLFSKLDAVLQGHRVVYVVALQISSRVGFKDDVATKKLGGVGSLLDVWKPIQAEVRALLHDYLMEDEGAAGVRNAVISVNDVLRDHRFGRDRGKQLFKLNDASAKSMPGTTRRGEGGVLQRHQLAVTQALKASVPGLVSSIDSGVNAGRQGQIIGIASSASGTASGTTGAGTGRGGRGMEYTGAGHRLLVKPDAFNVSVLFQPALAFVERVAAVMPSSAAGETSRGFSAFLEEFVQDVFLPQLEEKVSTLFAGATSHADSFSEDPASRQLGAMAASRPVVKSASNVIVLIDSLYSMLRTTPFHRESYSRLIVTVIIQYYQKCGERFRDLVSIQEADRKADGAKYALSANWAQRPELVACLAEMRDEKVTAQRRAELLAQEARFELAYANSREPIAIHELTTSRKKLMALGCLQHSVEWFAANVGRLKPTSEGQQGKEAEMARAKRAKARLSVIDALALAENRSLDVGEEEDDEGQQGELALPLTPELVARYSSLAGVYHQLSSSILSTLRVEVRLRIIAYLHLAVTESTYAVNDTAVEPAPHVVDLNAELANLDDILCETLPASSRAFVLSGLSTLMDSVLIASVHKIKAVNRQGTTKMLRNILALQQNLKNILPESTATTSLEKSRKFYELLYSKSPAELLNNMKRFSKVLRFPELQAILNLALGIDNPFKSSSSSSGADKVPLAQPNAGTLALTHVSRQKLNEYLIELHEIAGEHDSSDDDQ